MTLEGTYSFFLPCQEDFIIIYRTTESKKLIELFFQGATYAGMPAVNEALAVYRDVPIDRGEWPIEA